MQNGKAKKTQNILKSTEEIIIVKNVVHQGGN